MLIPTRRGRIHAYEGHIHPHTCLVGMWNEALKVNLSYESYNTSADIIFFSNIVSPHSSLFDLVLEDSHDS
jgi:hypothetical protein